MSIVTSRYQGAVRNKRKWKGVVLLSGHQCEIFAPVIRQQVQQRMHLRHETRTHRVELDRLLERMNLDHLFLIKYVRASDQLAGILTRVRSLRCCGSHR